MTKARPRLLVVDDDRAILSMLVAGLSRAGFDVVVATNADEAMGLAVEVQPALMIIDVEMGGRNGVLLAENVARGCHVPFLLLAAARDDQIQQKVAALGAAGFVSKPVDMTRLVPAIRSVLEHPAGSPPAGKESILLADTFEGGHGPQALVAIGILVERHKVNCDEAVRILHQRAAAAGLAVDEAALALIEQAESVARPSV